MKVRKKISAIKARRNLGQVMNEVAIGGDDYIVERAGKPLVAIIPLEKYWKLQRDLDEFARQLENMRANVKEEDPEVIDELIEEAIQATRRPGAKKSKAKSKTKK